MLVSLVDAITSLDALFIGNATIAAPGMRACGADPTDDAIGCEAYDACDGSGRQMGIASGT